MARIEMMLGRRPIEEGASGADVEESEVTLAPVKSNLGKWPRSVNMRIVEVGDSVRMDLVGEAAFEMVKVDLSTPEGAVVKMAPVSGADSFRRATENLEPVEQIA